MILSLFQLMCSLVFANPTAEQMALIQNPIRPSVSDFFENSALLTPYRVDRASPQKDYALYRLHAPRLIVSLEKAFGPDARFGFIGLNVELIAEATEAFYRSIGQTDRVVKIPLGPHSIGEFTSPNDIIRFMQAHGLEPVTAENPRPLILIDVSNFTESTFLRMLTTQLVQNYHMQGIEYADLTRWFNVAILPRGGEMLSVIDPLPLNQEELQEQLRLQSEGITARGFSQIFSFPNTMAVAYGAAWSGPYGSIHTRDGVYVTRPREELPVPHRASVLAQIIDIVTEAKSKEFHAKVTALARNHDVSFEVRTSRATSILSAPLCRELFLKTK